MPSPQPHRRDFLRRAGARGAACVLPTAARAHQPAVVVRQSIADFAKNDQALDALRAGVQKVRDLDPKHPFHWTFQANSHWRPLFAVGVYERLVR